MNPKEMLFYLAGPYSSDPESHYLWHLSEAERLMNNGILCYAPIVETHRWHGQYTHTHDAWLARDLRFLARCDAFIRLPGESPGSDIELREAKKIGLPIWIGQDPVGDLIEGEEPTLPAKAYETGRTHDPVNHPSHYTQGGIETIDFIEAKGLDYHRGNAVKYITRAGLKGDYVEDIQKAIWYLRRSTEKKTERRNFIPDFQGAT